METAVQQLVAKIVEHFHPREVYLFGSRVHGTSLPTSDYDLLIVMDRLTEPAYRYSQEAHEILWGLNCSKDIFFTTTERFEELKSSVGSLSELAHRDGKQIYAAA